MKKFFRITKMSQTKLKAWLEKELKKNGNYEIIRKDGFLFGIPIANPVPILLTAHMDTVHKVPVKNITVEKHAGKTIISSPQGIGGDDRCGVYMILELLKCGYSPYVLFCEDEEIGSVGAGKFAKTDCVELLKDCKYFVELDRRGSTDAVFYECGNEDFKKYIQETTGYKENYGTWSDICELSPICDIASVNLSCGYYNEHKIEHYVVWEEMLQTIQAVERLILDASNAKNFDFQEVIYWGKSSFGLGGYSSAWGYDEYPFYYMEKDTLNVSTVKASDYYEALGIFMEDHPTICCNDLIDPEEFEEVI